MFTIKKLILASITVCVFLSIMSCSTLPTPSASTSDNTLRNPLVFIPGIMGSIISENGETKFGALSRSSSEADLALPLDTKQIHSPQIDNKHYEILAIFKAGLNFSKESNNSSIYGSVGASVPVYRPFICLLKKHDYKIDDDCELDGQGEEFWGKGGFKFGFGEIRDKDFEKPQDEKEKVITRNNLLLFPYDWRLDNAVNAIRFAKFLTESRKTINDSTKIEIEELKKSGNKEKLDFAKQLENWLKNYKFDVVAHSNGGLIARYFFYYGDQPLDISGELPRFDWGGTKEIQRLFLVGTPNLGAPKALKILTEGSDDIPTQDYNPDIVGSFPSMYQLLPKDAVAKFNDGNKPIEVDLFDIKTWLNHNWGLAKSEKKISKAYLEACLNRAKRFHAALNASPKNKAAPPETSVFIASGTDQNTWTSIFLPNQSGLPVWEDDRLTQDGDGTVPNTSASAALNLKNINYKVLGPYKAEHTELIYNKEFLEQLFTFLDNSILSSNLENTVNLNHSTIENNLINVPFTITGE
jgi:hypothetical protein